MAARERAEAAAEEVADTPTVSEEPGTGARPCSAAAAMTAAQRAPAPTVAVRVAGSTLTASSRRVEISRPEVTGVCAP